MLKRIVVGIITVVMAALTLSGCSFFTHDYERDWQQEIAVVRSYKISNSVEVGEGDQKTYETREYTTAAKTIYKRDLVEYVNNNASTLSQNYAGNPQGMYEYAAQMLVNIELVTNEVDALIDCKKIKWGVTQQNAVRRGIYNVIDGTILSLKNNILEERDMEKITTDSESSSDTEKSTTYPVKPAETDDDVEKPDAIEVWTPDRSSWPAINDSDMYMRAVSREAVARFVSLIKNRVNGDFRLARAERKWLGDKINNEIKAIDRLIVSQGIESVYPVIGTYSYPMKDSTSEFGYIMYYLSGLSLERSQKITELQSYLSKSVVVDYSEVLNKYQALKNEQKSLYIADIAAYDTAVNDTSSTVLYHASANYFYVKHILLPFSDAQKADLTAFKARPEIKSLQKDEQDERVKEYRAQLAESITCYPHVNGEDDKTRPMSVSEVMSHIRSVMMPAQANIKTANEKFNDLIYLYNTDPGAFNNDKGYIVKYKKDKDESEKYMQEFADAARYMYENLEQGKYYDVPVITDYGVHIMYLSSVNRVGEIGLYDSTSPNGAETYYDLIEKPLRTARENAAYEKWERDVFTFNYKKYSSIYTDVFSDLWAN